MRKSLYKHFVLNLKKKTMRAMRKVEGGEQARTERAKEKTENKEENTH